MKKISALNQNTIKKKTLSSVRQRNNIINVSKNKIASFLNDFYPLLKEKIETGKKILICGNGGSASDSNHFAAELTGKFKSNKRKLISCISLSSNSSSITSIANDFNFSQIFSKQIEALGREGDICICLSTSGKSKNIIKAIKTCNKKKITTVGFFGKYKSERLNKCKFTLNINSNNTALIQELHYITLHLICELLEDDFINAKKI